MNIELIGFIGVFCGGAAVFFGLGTLLMALMEKQFDDVFNSDAFWAGFFHTAIPTLIIVAMFSGLKEYPVAIIVHTVILFVLMGSSVFCFVHLLNKPRRQAAYGRLDPPGGEYFLHEPTFIGRIPARTEIMVLGGDEFRRDPCGRCGTTIVKSAVEPGILCDECAADEIVKVLDKLQDKPCDFCGDSIKDGGFSLTSGKVACGECKVPESELDHCIRCKTPIGVRDVYHTVLGDLLDRQRRCEACGPGGRGRLAAIMSSR